jgi:hypothetical protein
MILTVAMVWIHLMFVLVLLNIHEICLKLKSGFRIIRKFLILATFSLPIQYNCHLRGAMYCSVFLLLIVLL